MQRAVIFPATAAAAFLLTTLYLRHQPPPEPAPVQPSIRVASAAPEGVTAEDSIARSTAPSAPSQPIVEIEARVDPNAKERRQLAEYFAGIRNLAPLSAEQQRAVLEAKLRHKRIYEIALRDSGLERESLSTAERAYAHELLARALDDYRQAYLMDAKSVLTEQQYELLANFEATEFELALQNLQKQINAK